MAIYNGKHVVFEQVGTESVTNYWNVDDNNTDGDGCTNNYEISGIRNTLSSTILPKLSDGLTGQLVSTTVQTAKNGNSTTLISTDDKLFLPAEKEIGHTTYSLQVEKNVVITWQYWTTHTSNNDHIKYNMSSTASAWWNRSPRKDTTNQVCLVQLDGSTTAAGTYNSRYISSCFAF